MPTTRLTQIGVGGTPYTWPINVDLISANWGWTAYPIGVAYEKAATTRLGQMGVSAKAYPPPYAGEIISLSSANWGWTANNITVDYQDPQLVDLTKTDWGWTAQNLTICSQSNFGYYGSFNDAVWPTCSFNDHVFGPRTHLHLEFDRNDWGWQSFPIDASFTDPIDVDLTRANWGWFAYPLSVSYGYDIQLQIMPWGWQSFNIAVELPYDIDLSHADWGWRAHPIGVSYGTDIGLTTATWGWQTNPLTIEVPSFDIALRKADWGWQSFPIEVRQTQLLPGDIDAIADAVYEKFVSEGVIQQILETWQRQGCDGSYPQDIPPSPGQYIEVGGMRIYVERLPDGKIRHTRQ